MPLFGFWYWVQSVGGIAGITQTPATVGYTRIFAFDGIGNFYEFRNNVLLNRARYRVVTKPTIFGTTSQVLEVTGYPDMIVSFPNFRTMVLTENVFDGFTLTFIRIF
ncbi:MAG: hypothetical protein CVV03_11190 [Firmicutes bacterium HGW-Firmicutes-8]|nr:MAG: hypothetical protein CVV03_11190 [Firmicutes bacterium HGW-Firmicutes-8]